MKQILLDFGHFQCRAELFNSPVAESLYEILPVTIPLTRWGNELYGPVNKDCGEEKLVAEIPEGGIAYTRQGNLLCIFFGQTPAWNVEHIGNITNDEWKKLKVNKSPERMIISIEN